MRNTIVARANMGRRHVPLPSRTKPRIDSLAALIRIGALEGRLQTGVAFTRNEECLRVTVSRQTALERKLVRTAQPVEPGVCADRFSKPSNTVAQ